MSRNESSLAIYCYLLVAGLLFYCNAAQAQRRGGAAPAETEQPRGPAGKVAGTVHRMDDGSPLPKATVTLAPEGRQAEASSVITDGNGRFEFPEVSPGRYQVRAQRNGYVAQSYGQRGAGRGMSISVEPGQSMQRLDFRLERAGVISGSVIDEDNEPVEGVDVRAMRVRFSPGGREQLVPLRNARTDDQGNFRLPGLTPGLYYVQAGGRSGGPRFGGFGAAIGYTVTFYPGVTRREDAQSVQVTAGREMSRIDMGVRSTPTFSLSGVINDSKSGGGQRRYNIGFASGGGSAMTNVDRDDGTFVMRGLEPGDYSLIAQVWDGEGPPRNGFRNVQIVNSDVQVVVEIGAGATVRGALRAADGNPISFSGMLISLQSTDERGTIPSGVIDDKGRFAVSNVPAGKYLVQLATRDRTLYLKDARCRGQDALASAVELNSAEVMDSCELTVARDVGRVIGTVKQDEQPAAGMAVVLIPADLERRKIARYTAIAQTGAKGVFEVIGVVPGEYFAFAVTPADDAPYYQLEFPERNRESATRITVRPSELLSVDLKVPNQR